MKYCVKISYDGSKFYGFQRQKDKITVQGELEKALGIINKGMVEIKGAGRTDVGVHAYGQVVHFNLDFDIPPERLKEALASIVRPYIDILECRRVDSSFHARFSVKSKEYVYKIWRGNYDPCKYGYYLMYDKDLNVDKLRECAEIFKGKHNFHNFVSGFRDSYNGEIFNIEVVEENETVLLIFKGKSFYRYMVRNIVGAMLSYNEGKVNLETIKKMVNDSDFNYQLPTALANGLYLSKVNYD